MSSASARPFGVAIADNVALQSVNSSRMPNLVPEQEVARTLSKPSLNEISSPETGNFKVWNSYQALVRSTLNLVGLAKVEVHLASTYYEPIIGSKLVEKFAQGISLNVLDGNPSGTTFVERIREAARIDSKNRDILNALLESPRVKIRNAGIRYSFIVVDRVHCGFELLDPLVPTQFNMAIQIDDVGLAEKLIEQFERVMSETDVN